MSIITVQQLTKTFGDRTAVDGISFSVKRGDIFAFLGPNGAGKTTTIRMLTTLLLPTKGTIIIDGKDAVRSPDVVRKSFGIVFQDPSLDTELTAEENMKFHAVLYGMSPHSYGPRINELLEMVELSDRSRDLVKNFSGGMKRRLEIARGLLHHPVILFLDEPTLGLDPQTRNRMWQYIRNLNQKEGTTIFFSTHYMDEAERFATAVCIIDHGNIVAQGTTESLKQETESKTLEDAFLTLTGHDIRDEEPGMAEYMRAHMRVWRRS